MPVRWRHWEVLVAWAKDPSDTLRPLSEEEEKEVLVFVNEYLEKMDRVVGARKRVGRVRPQDDLPDRK